MFRSTKKAQPDVSKWNVNNLKHMAFMFAHSEIKKLDLSKWTPDPNALQSHTFVGNMFQMCRSLDYLKTPVGLKTSIIGANKGFKIVKLKKGFAASVEKEDQNLNSEYTINNDGDKKAMYHIYAKDAYAGVIFDKNSGNTEGWVNHEIANKSKSIKESDGSLPTEKPTLAGDEF